MIWNIIAGFVKFGRTESWPSSLLHTHWGWIIVWNVSKIYILKSSHLLNNVFQLSIRLVNPEDSLKMKVSAWLYVIKGLCL